MSHSHSRSLSGRQPRDSTEQWGAEDFAYLRGAIADGPSDEATAGVKALDISDTGRPQDSEAGDPSARPTSSHEVPPRISSARKYISTPKERQDDKGPPSSPTAPKTPAGPPQVVGHQTSRSLDVAPGDSSSLQPRQQPPPRDSSARKAKTSYSSTAPPLPQQQQTASSTAPESSDAVATEPSTRPYFSRQTTMDRAKAAEASPSLSGNPEAAVLLSAAGNPPSQATTEPNGLTARENERPIDPSSSNGPSRTAGPTQTSTMSQPVALPEHVRLPEGFTLENSTTTHVDTAWNTPITHHTIQKQRREEHIHPVLTHHHIHHYYTYTQPVKVVEVLPSKHYRIDDTTGEKVEIDAPEGWTAPEDLARPTSAGGAGTTFDGELEPIERHYLVDEEHPQGQIEGPMVGQGGDTTGPRQGAAEERMGW